MNDAWAAVIVAVAAMIGENLRRYFLSRDRTRGRRRTRRDDSDG